jgi:hypothetical protein
MEDLAEQFKKALARIEISGDKRERAIAAHTEIREVLEGSEALCALGVDTALIGSYARQTGIYPGKDVDVFVKLTKLDTSAPPQDVYNAVRDVLVAKYGDRAEEQPRSIKVSFDTDGDGFSVDAVPAVQMGSRWAIPRRDRERWESPDTSERWVETDPEHLGKLTGLLNGKLKVDGQGAYVPTVKLVRQTRRHNMRDSKPGGLYFELLTYWAFLGGAVNGDCFAQIFAEMLRAIANQLVSGQVVVDPVLERPTGRLRSRQISPRRPTCSLGLRRRPKRRCRSSDARQHCAGGRSSGATTVGRASSSRRAVTSVGSRSDE